MSGSDSEPRGAPATAANAAWSAPQAAPAAQPSTLYSDDRAVADLHARYYRQLVRLAVALTDADSAEDVVQDAFVKVWRRWRWIRDLDRAEYYLRRAVVNVARDRLRRVRVARGYQWPDEQRVRSAQAEVLIAEEHQEVLDALARLPDRQRQVIVLRYFGELTEAETASTLGIGVGTVKAYAHRGIARIREELS